MNTSKGRLTLGKKMYLFIIATILFAVSSVCALSYYINRNQIDGYYKRMTIGVAKNVATALDVDFFMELRGIAESEEFQAIRDQAEEEDDDTAVIEYLQEAGLWEKYQYERNRLIQYVDNMEEVQYLYIVVWGDMNAQYDMFLMDADDVAFYVTGYYELREAEFAGTDPTKDIDPVISNGDWGWLCSGYAAVYDEAGNIVCHVGCDVGMDDVVRERKIYLRYVVLSALLCAIIVLLFAVVTINKTIVGPLKHLTKEMEKFSPAENCDYQQAGVITCDVKSNDEISDIYQGVHSMQVRIVDYINNITAIRRDKEKAEDDARNKEAMIGEISKDAYRDALTGVGNKAAYVKKNNELNELIKDRTLEIAVVMIDVNGLKAINDNYGHSLGDIYLKGVCRIICNVFKHSPVYRIGGDEFVAILMGEDYKDRMERMGEIRRAFVEYGENQKLNPWERYSASVGIADRTAGDESVEFIFRRADKYMYEDKLKYKEKHGIAPKERV